MITVDGQISLFATRGPHGRHVLVRPMRRSCIDEVVPGNRDRVRPQAATAALAPRPSVARQPVGPRPRPERVEPASLGPHVAEATSRPNLSSPTASSGNGSRLDGARRHAADRRRCCGNPEGARRGGSFEVFGGRRRGRRHGGPLVPWGRAVPGSPAGLRRARTLLVLLPIGVSARGSGQVASADIPLASSAGQGGSARAGSIRSSLGLHGDRRGAPRANHDRLRFGAFLPGRPSGVVVRWHSGGGT